MSGKEQPWWVKALQAMVSAYPPPENFGKGIPDKELLTLEEAAPYLGYTHVESFRRAIREGRSPVKHVKLNGQKFILKYDLVNHLWHSRQS